MAKVKKYTTDGERMTSVWNDNGDKRYGFVTKDRAYSDPKKTRYGFGVDNMGSPYRGVSDNEINTPIGQLDYGYDGDTIYGGFTPNAYRTTWSAPMGDGRGTVSQDYGTLEIGNDAMLRGGRYGNTVDGNTYFASAFLPGDQQYIPNINRSINTPVGRFGVETNYDVPNTVEANFTPNDYIMALANLLRR